MRDVRRERIAMSDKVYPIDKIGNQLREGRLVILKLEDPDAMFYIDNRWLANHPGIARIRSA